MEQCFRLFKLRISHRHRFRVYHLRYVHEQWYLVVCSSRLLWMCKFPLRTTIYSTVTLLSTTNTLVRTTICFAVVDMMTALPQIFFIQPTGCPVTGGVVLTIQGNDLSTSQLWCKFDTTVVTATCVQPSGGSCKQVTCTAPPHSAASLKVGVSNNNQDYAFFDSPFLYYGTLL